MKFKIISILFTLSLNSMAFIGGNLAHPGEFPSVVWIENGCTGSLIAPDKILLAAHCVRPYKYYPLHHVGQTIRIYNTPVAIISRQTAASIKKIIVHPDWVKKIDAGIEMTKFFNLKNATDLAVIVLNEPLDAPGIQVTKISFAQLKKDQVVLIGGYGCEEKAVQPMEPKYKFAYKKIQTFNGNLFGISEIDAEEKSTSMGCEGDSGGPVYIIENNEKIQVGVNSNVRGNQKKGRLNIVNLSRFEPWLRSVLANSILLETD